MWQPRRGPPGFSGPSRSERLAFVAALAFLLPAFPFFLAISVSLLMVIPLRWHPAKSGVFRIKELLELLAVVDAGVGRVPLTDDLVRLVDADMVLSRRSSCRASWSTAHPCFSGHSWRGVFSQFWGVLPALTSSFSSRLLRCLGADTMLAPTIWPPRAM